ncbi:hypothetical protein [Deinococcus marmoris]|uniref:Uncharacterized protein n=1 Tax=Deinococcus marmoris TaxID=249408 RepID=A0A1U7P0P1_9DEIO|nr:hypothetical protein [Deinococcus marmoris]OLV18739.1 hypothetical protein BOO71_0004924 [Deinococcus marmoris]
MSVMIPAFYPPLGLRVFSTPSNRSPYYEGFGMMRGNAMIRRDYASQHGRG